ncbi:hypothetical protein KO527_05380 [Pseudoalteromonas sp. C2R02]|uniref:hypothetical protein n=1 Tax=Pseudoalteromonas sp. C2R02 TaxID=2841565 RepID=UPI001C0A131E|nr:hypothetical protein [Pseudoalteromonas sp. C2R02]MBU2968780.1 hypothetical protein [Pseudoalteromonas sp. C2R02]
MSLESETLAFYQRKAEEKRQQWQAALDNGESDKAEQLLAEFSSYQNQVDIMTI